MLLPVRLTENGKLDALEDRLIREMRDLKLAMDQSDVTQDMVLDEIKLRDIDNLLLVLKSSKSYFYDRKDVAFYNIGQFLNRALSKLGCDALNHFAKRPDPQNADHRFLERKLQHQMLKKGIKCEARPVEMYDPPDRWRSGMFVYKENEIAYYISNIIEQHGGRSGGGHIILPGQRKYLIITNAPSEFDMVK